MNAQAIGCVGEAPHFRDRYENEDWLKILHFRASVLFTTERTVRSFHRCLSCRAGTIGSDYGIHPSENDKCPKQSTCISIMEIARAMSAIPKSGGTTDIAECLKCAKSRYRWSGLRPTRCRSEHIRVTEKVLKPKACLR